MNTQTLETIAVIAALVCFLIAAFETLSPKGKITKINWIPFGYAFLTVLASLLLGLFGK